MFEYFYHEILRSTIIGFGTLFNNIYLKKFDDNGKVISTIKVPLAYGPRQKFLARIEQSPSNLNNPVQITLPRMSFEFTGLTYDGDRKISTTEYFTISDPKNPKGHIKTYMPVPYNMRLELNILSKINDDSLQIIEQILPYFQPAYTLTIDLMRTIGEKRDVPFQLESIEMQDDYEGNFETRRALIYKLIFTAKIYLFGPSKNISDNIIRKTTIGYLAGSSSKNPDELERDATYTVTPTATKSYSDYGVAFLIKDVSRSDTRIFVNDVTQISLNSIITLNDESLKVVGVDTQNKVVSVIRGSFNTKSMDHVSGTEVQKVIEQDNDLIQPGDDFGFDGRLF
jgi:hypothetical protein